VNQPLSDARQTLLRALDHLDDIEANHGEARRIYLCVTYAHNIDGQTISGWASTDDPTFVTCALLRVVADSIETGTGWDDDDKDPAGDDA